MKTKEKMMKWNKGRLRVRWDGRISLIRSKDVAKYDISYSTLFF